MPFYFKKSVSAGPFRFNLSKSGVGLSVGIKGLRIGVGPRGHYIHAGRGGLYYRASLGRAGQKGENSQSTADTNVGSSSNAPRSYMESNVEMFEVESGDVLAMHDENLRDVLDEINAKQAQISFATVFGFAFTGLGLAVAFLSTTVAVVVICLALPAWAVGLWLDTYKRRSVLFYNLDDDTAKAYEALTRSFDNMISCAGKWHVEAGGTVNDIATWKQNAGATHIVQKKQTSLSYAMPKIIASNITPPAIQVGRQTIYFWPDAAFIVDGKRVGAIAYDNLEAVSKGVERLEPR